jgi:sulfite exporter TauE/SafE
MVRPVLWGGVKAMRRETLSTGGIIMSDIAVNTLPEVTPCDIVAKSLGKSVQNLIQKLREGAVNVPP